MSDYEHSTKTAKGLLEILGNVSAESVIVAAIESGALFRRDDFIFECKRVEICRKQREADAQAEYWSKRARRNLRRWQDSKTPAAGRLWEQYRLASSANDEAQDKLSKLHAELMALYDDAAKAREKRKARD